MESKDPPLILALKRNIPFFNSKSAHPLTSLENFILSLRSRISSSRFAREFHPLASLENFILSLRSRIKILNLFHKLTLAPYNMPPAGNKKGWPSSRFAREFHPYDKSNKRSKFTSSIKTY